MVALRIWCATRLCGWVCEWCLRLWCLLSCVCNIVLRVWVCRLWWGLVWVTWVWCLCGLFGLVISWGLCLGEFGVMRVGAGWSLPRLWGV